VMTSRVPMVIRNQYSERQGGSTPAGSVLDTGGQD